MEDMKKCCMVGCSNVSTDDGKYLFGFPSDFNLCMLWVQNSGKPEHFEDFAFGGAQPFLNRHICSDHFLDTDFIDLANKSLGILPKSIPQLNAAICLNKLKEEYHDPEFADVLNVISDTELLAQIKLEPSENDNEEVINNFSFSSNDDSGNDLDKNRDPLSESYAEEIKLSNDFFRDYDTAKKSASRKTNESERARRARLKKEALRAKQRRSRETEEQAKIRRMKNALCAAFRRKNETPEQREDRRKKNMIRAQMRRNAESEAQSRIRRYNDAVRAAYRRSNETEEERRERLMKDTMRAARRRSTETPEQRALRLKKDRDRATRRRMVKKIFEQMKYLNEAIEATSAVSLHQAVKVEPVEYDIDSTPLTMSSITSVVKNCTEKSNINRLQEVLNFIQNKVNGKSKSRERPGCSDESTPFVSVKEEVMDETTTEDANSFVTDDLEYQQNILHFLALNSFDSQSRGEENLPNVGEIQEQCLTIENLPKNSTSAGGKR